MVQVSHSNRWIYFDVNAFIRALERALSAVMYELRADMKAILLRRASALPFSRINAAHTAEGHTSDAARAAAFLDSFIPNKVIDMKNGVIRMWVDTMAKNFEDSHIGLYYEYGTGHGEAADSPLPYMGDWNPIRGAQRTGATIYTRPRVKTDDEVANTTWVDAGGNVRIASSRHIAKLSGKPGWDITAERWFTKGYEDIRDTYLDKIINAIAHINPVGEDFLIVKPIMANMGTI